MTGVLVDTSVWVAHFRRGNPAPRERTLGDLGRLRQANVATTAEVLSLIEARRLFDAGCGAVDVAFKA